MASARERRKSEKVNWGKRESELEKKLKKKAEEITLFFKNVTSFFSEAFKRDRNSY